MQSVGFSVDGSFITQLAREQCYEHGKFDYAVELLMSCMETDQLSKREIRHMAIDILNGEAEIHGVYPGDDYGFRYLDKKEERYDLGKLISGTKERYEKTKKECDSYVSKFVFLDGNLLDYKKRELNERYEEWTGDVLFTSVEEEEPNFMLDSFMARMTDVEEHETEDYGWLEPNGTFHEVEWGKHEGWAIEYLNEKFPDWDEKLSICHMSLAGDYLTDRGWVLLHNPAQGIAVITKNPTKRYTKAQQDFLYQYYIDRGCTKEANAIFEED